MFREWLVVLTEIFVPLIDLVALFMIVVGTVEAVIHCIRVFSTSRDNAHAAQAVWIRYSRWLVAALTFQLAADIIETSMTPTWEDIGRIAAIAVIRTFLNFFLERDQQEMMERVREESGRKTRE